MIWTAIETAAELLEKIETVGPYLARFLRVTGQHLKRKHGKKVESGASAKELATWLLSSATCACRRVIATQDTCPHSVGPNGLP